VHTHLIVNSVSFETGKKFRYSKHELQEMKDLSDVILREHGKTVCEKNQSITSFRMGAYRSIEKAVQGKYQSWMYDTMVAVDKAMKSAASKDDFISIMRGAGYAVNWQDSRKYIVFINADGKKVRDKALAKTFKQPISKEELLLEFSRRTQERNTGAKAGQARSGERKPAFVGKRRTQRTVAELQRELGRISKIHEGDTFGAQGDAGHQAGHAGGQQQHAPEQSGRKAPHFHRETGHSR
jgi:hypothetical protein